MSIKLSSTIGGEAVSPTDEPRHANVFTVPADRPFLDTFVKALLAGQLIEGFNSAETPLHLSQATIFVPNRRTARELGIAFLAHSQGKASLLPSIKTLGDVEGDDFGIVADLEGLSDLPRAIGQLERKLELSLLVQRWVDSLSAESRRLYGDEDIFIPSSQADAIRLSDDLCKLLEQITREEKDWDAIASIVPTEFAQWWDLTSTFLQIILEHWPSSLERRGLIDPSLRARLLLDQRIRHYQTNGAKGPVIVAGSTGSVPSTQRFLKVISQLSNGAVVLPGLDQTMTTQHWQRLQEDRLEPALESHPQFGLANTLKALGIPLHEVKELGAPHSEGTTRNTLVGLALSVPEFTADWSRLINGFSADAIDAAFSDVCLIEAHNERHEALGIALAMRETLEHPDKTVALVTADRNFANRVSVELERFGLTTDDSGGRLLAQSPVGRFVQTLIAHAFGQASVVELIGLLKSAFARNGATAADQSLLVERIEIHLLRGALSQPEPGSLGTWMLGQLEALQNSSRRAALSASDFEPEIAHANRFDQAVNELSRFSDRVDPAPLGKYIQALVNALELLCCDDADGFTLAQAPGWKELCGFFEEITAGSGADHAIAASDFPSVFEALIGPLVFREVGNPHPRLRIYGPLEIRLLDYDRVIIAGLNEGTWPRTTRSDAFINRAMRMQLGMASPERATGLSAHDFQQMMGKSQVILSRSIRVDRAPAIASRWVQRLSALLGPERTDQLRSRGSRYLDLASALERDQNPVDRVLRPDPKPPVEARPSRLPVTDVELLIRDPYALYAKRILNLRPLETLDRDADFLLKGTLYHAVMETYVETIGVDDGREERATALRDIAARIIAAQSLPDDIALLWQLRFHDIAARFVAWEARYHEQVGTTASLAEVNGTHVFANGSFTLQARADRVDRLTDGSLVVMDYKTGATPSLKVARTLAPQLALEGAIAMNGGFEDIPVGPLAGLKFVRLRDGDNFKVEELSSADMPLDALVSRAVNNLETMIAHYRFREHGYVSRRAPVLDGDMSGDYDHLARTREWSFGEGRQDD